MKEGIFIHGRQIHLRQGGGTIELDIASAKRTAQRILEVVDEVELLLEEDRLLWQEILELDLELRDNLDVWWARSLQLIDGHYVADPEFTQWNLLWTSIINTNDETVLKLWEKGCFDSLLRSDNSLHSDLNNPQMSIRLRSMSESMQWVDSGAFTMGDESVDAWEFESPSRTVNLNQGFWMGSVPVTQHFYKCVMGSFSEDIQEKDRGPLRPIVSVSWWETLVFCNILSQLSNRHPVYWYDGEIMLRVPCNPRFERLRWRAGNGYRLPSEAEWECAARAWQNTSYSGGEQALQFGWMELEETMSLPLVQQKKPNLLGLYDMSGLIWEWCWDGYDPDFYKQNVQTDPVCHVGEQRVCRGGSFFAERSNSRVSMRRRCPDQTRWRGLGFRLVCFD